MGCLSCARGLPGKGADGPKRGPKRPSWIHIRIDEDSGMRRQSLMDGSEYIEPVANIGILLYIRIAGVDVEQVGLDPFTVAIVRTDFVCLLAESVETLPSVVQDFSGAAGMISDVPCHPSHGLIFGGFLPTDELHRHHGKDVTTINDILAVLRSDAVFTKLKAAAAMPRHSTRPDGSIHFEFFAVEGCPDPPDRPGKYCPWDRWTIAWDLWSIVPPLPLQNEDSRPEDASEASPLKLTARSFNEGSSDNASCADHPDTLLSHRSSASDRFSGSSYWCLPAVVDLDCERREKFAHVIEHLSCEASTRRRHPRKRLPPMSGDRPSRWWLEVQPVPEYSRATFCREDIVRGNCWCGHVDERTPCELQIQEPPHADSGECVWPISHRSSAGTLSLLSSSAPQPGVSSERTFEGPCTPRLLYQTPRQPGVSIERTMHSSSASSHAPQQGLSSERTEELRTCSD